MVAHRIHVSEERPCRQDRAFDAPDHRLHEVPKAGVELGGDLGLLDRDAKQVGLEHVDDAVGVLEQGHHVGAEVGDECAGEELRLDRAPQRVLTALDLLFLIEKAVIGPVHAFGEVGGDCFLEHEPRFGDLVEKFVDLVLQRTGAAEQMGDLAQIHRPLRVLGSSRPLPAFLSASRRPQQVAGEKCGQAREPFRPIAESLRLADRRDVPSLVSLRAIMEKISLNVRHSSPGHASQSLHLQSSRRSVRPPLVFPRNSLRAARTPARCHHRRRRRCCRRTPSKPARLPPSPGCSSLPA